MWGKEGRKQRERGGKQILYEIKGNRIFRCHNEDRASWMKETDLLFPSQINFVLHIWNLLITIRSVKKKLSLWSSNSFGIFMNWPCIKGNGLDHTLKLLHVNSNKGNGKICLEEELFLNLEGMN